MITGGKRLWMSAVVTAAALSALAAIALAADVGCGGGGPICEGTSGDDVITGTKKHDEIIAKGGDDLADGGRRGDVIDAGSGDDGRDGTDAGLLGGTGGDRIVGGRGGDWMMGEEGHDDLYGGRGNDFLDSYSDLQDVKDVVDCGRGSEDGAIVDAATDTVKNCENICAAKVGAARPASASQPGLAAKRARRAC